MVINMYNMNDIDYISKVLNLNFDKYTKEEFLEGLNIESEHGFINPETNVTNNDLITTAKIALAHLNEYPNYYNKEYGLKIFEKFLKEKIINKNPNKIKEF